MIDTASLRSIAFLNRPSWKRAVQSTRNFKKKESAICTPPIWWNILTRDSVKTS